MDHDRLRQILVALLHFSNHPADQRDIPQLGKLEQIGPQPVIDIVVVVGDIVRKRRSLRFRRGVGVHLQVMQGQIFP